MQHQAAASLSLKTSRVSDGTPTAPPRQALSFHHEQKTPFLSETCVKLLPQPLRSVGRHHVCPSSLKAPRSKMEQGAASSPGPR